MMMLRTRRQLRLADVSTSRAGGAVGARAALFVDGGEISGVSGG
jgi:hypothetical protein